MTDEGSILPAKIEISSSFGDELEQRRPIPLGCLEAPADRWHDVVRALDPLAIAAERAGEVLLLNTSSIAPAWVEL